MFRKKPHATNSSTKQGIDTLSSSFSSLTAEDMKKICKEGTRDQLESAISSLNSLLDQLSKIEAHFQYYIGYSSREAAINGIKSYATGEVRKSGQELDEAIESFAQSMSVMFNEPQAKKSQTPQAKQQNEDLMVSTENLAKLYMELSNAKPKLESHLVALTNELHQRSEQKSIKSNTLRF